MTSYFASMIDVVSAHPYYAYSAIFLAALSEAIPLVGTVVPGSTLVVAISALAAGAGANSWLMLVAAISSRDSQFLAVGSVSKGYRAQ